jgi:multiple sugar transport system substrate-binding protein
MAAVKTVMKGVKEMSKETHVARNGVITRRTLMASAAAGFGLAAIGAPRRSYAQGKPAKLLVVGDSAPWKGTIIQDAIPAFTKQHGIEVEYTQLPNEAMVTRMKAELMGGSNTIDVIQLGASQVGWMGPYLEDVQELIKKTADKHPDFNWGDFPEGVKQLYLHEKEKRYVGVPYRSTTYILHYQKELLEQAGIARPPQTFPELLEAAVALTKQGNGTRFGIGTCARQGGAIVDHFLPWLRSAGADLYDPQTGEIFVTRPEAIEALQFYGDLLAKHKVMPPDAVTWEWDEIIANGQNDRYAMAVTVNASATPLNRNPSSKTAGKWSWTVVPGMNTPEQSKSLNGGWAFAVPKDAKNKEWAWEFVQHITGPEWSRRSMEKGNAPARQSVLNDPKVIQEYGWAPASAASLKTAVMNPRDPNWGAFEQHLRSGISQAMLGQTTAKQAMENVASNWKRVMVRTGQN